MLSTTGAVGSSALVAYGFARFRFPGRNLLFVILLATIILPFQVTLIPQYVIFTRLGWNGTWLPLIVPAPVRERLQRVPAAAVLHDDPARPRRGGADRRGQPVPGAPVGDPAASMPAIIAVSLFHFFFAWNDFFVPLLYLAGKPSSSRCRSASRSTTSYSTQPTLIQAAALMTMAVPVVIFFLAQRFYMQGVVATGVEK